MTLRSTINAMLLAATAALAPAPLLAQVTTFIAPPRKAAVDSTKTTVAAATAAQRDTMARMTLSNMKAWVDSAAGVSTTSTEVAVADTSAPATNQPTSNATSNTSRTGTTTFSNGAIAPNTASPLPIYLAAGIVLIFAGVGSLRLAHCRLDGRRRDG